MKKLEHLLYKDWKYKIIALITAITLWAIVNFGNRVQVTIERKIQVTNASSEFSYILRPEKVKIKLKLIERLNRSSIFANIIAYVNVKGFKEGKTTAEVEVYTPLKPFISVQYIEPPRVEVFIIPNKRKNSRNRRSQ